MPETRAVCPFCTDALCGTPEGGTCNEAAQAQRIAELEAENANFFVQIHDGFAKINLLTDANATLTAQLGTAITALERIDSSPGYGGAWFRAVAREALAAIGTAQDGAGGRA